MSERNERCETCKYSDDKKSGYLLCRVRSPSVFLARDGASWTAWPKVESMHWCGEYKPREGGDKDATQTLNDTALDEASREFLDALEGRIFNVPCDVFAHTGAAMKIAIAKYLEVAK